MLINWWLLLSVITCAWRAAFHSACSFSNNYMQFLCSLGWYYALQFYLAKTNSHDTPKAPQAELCLYFVCECDVVLNIVYIVSDISVLLKTGYKAQIF
jgi:hypothetical protein